MSSAALVLRRALVYGGLLTLGIAVVGAVAGWFIAGWSGVVSAVVGSVMAGAFLAITPASILVASRVSRSGMLSVAYFGIVVGGLLLKLVLFVVLVYVLRGQDWIQPIVVFVSTVAGVLGSLIIDVLVVARSRVPYVDVALPGDGDGAES